MSGLDDFLMNPLVQGHSGTATERSRNAFGTNQGTIEDDSQSNLYPEASIFPSQTTQKSGPENGQDLMTGVLEEVTYWSSAHLQANRKGTALPVNRNSTERRLLRRSKNTKFCWPFRSWQTITLLHISLTISTELPSCQKRSRQRCPRSTGNMKSLSCWEISCKRVSKITINWLKMTESITSILSWGERRFKHLKTLMANPRESGRNYSSFPKEICETPIDADSETIIPKISFSTQQIRTY